MTQISLNVTQLHVDTLIALAADLSQQVDAQDWTNDDEIAALESVLGALYMGYAAHGLEMDQIDAALALADASADVIDTMTTTMITQGLIC